MYVYLFDLVLSCLISKLSLCSAYKTSGKTPRGSGAEEMLSVAAEAHDIFEAWVRRHQK